MVVRLYIVFREVTNHRFGLGFLCCASMSLVYKVGNCDFCDLINGNAVSLKKMHSAFTLLAASLTAVVLYAHNVAMENEMFI